MENQDFILYKAFFKKNNKINLNKDLFFILDHNFLNKMQFDKKMLKNKKQIILDVFAHFTLSWINIMKKVN